MKKKIIILGSTGSIGRQALEVIEENQDEFELFAVCANKSYDVMLQQIRRFKPKFAALADRQACLRLKREYEVETEILTSPTAINEIASLKADITVCAFVGAAGLLPTLSAIKNSRRVALANKESLVIAGKIVMEEAAKNGCEICPVDSEHSAIWQCLRGEKKEEVSRLILTASGGAFRDVSIQETQTIKASQALQHPTWKMGAKITIDCATMMNKGFEVIEAMHLFDMPIEKIDVIMHRESIIHSMVEFIDGSIKCQMGVADMKVPIRLALTFPKRRVGNEKLNLALLNQLTFSLPDREKYPCFALAAEAAKMQGNAPCVLNAANDVLVHEYLEDRIYYKDISVFVQKALDKFAACGNYDLESLLQTDNAVREYVKSIC